MAIKAQSYQHMKEGQVAFSISYPFLRASVYYRTIVVLFNKEVKSVILPKTISIKNG